jgi:hypothetical protein
MIKKKSLYLLLLLVLLATACTPSSVQTEETAPPEPTVRPTQFVDQQADVQPTEVAPAATAQPEPDIGVAPLLSTELVRGCLRGDQTENELREGDPAVEFSLMDVEGETYVLSELLQEKPIALIYGSYT